MKVHLKETVLDRIIERVYQAKRDNRVVEYITVTPPEYAELRNDGRARVYVQNDYSFMRPSDIDCGATTLDTLDFDVKPKAGDCMGQRYRVASHEKFMGVPLFVVPEFCVV
jgi:hypothetical protein